MFGPGVFMTKILNFVGGSFGNFEKQTCEQNYVAEKLNERVYQKLSFQVTSGFVG